MNNNFENPYIGNILKEILIYNISEMFSEIEQEEIINKFLDDININETEKIIKKEIAKHNYNPIELFHLNLPSESLKLINDYGKGGCKCGKCIYLNRVMFIHTDERYNDRIKTHHFFSELYRFPEEDVLKRRFKLSKNKYWLFFNLFRDMDVRKDIVKQGISATYHRKNEDKVLKEFNEIIKFIYENNYTKFKDIKLNYYPEF